MRSTLRKWKAVMNVCVQDSLAYRASALIWIVTDLVTAVTFPIVWAKAAANHAIAGYHGADFVSYYCGLLLVQSFVQSHMMWEIAQEIKEGQFSTALLRPVSFFQFTFFRSLAWRLMRTVMFLPILAVLLILYRPLLVGAHFYIGWEFWVSLILGHFVSFTFVIAFAMIALYVQEAQAIFELYYVPMLFLSGQLFPIAVLPGWAQALKPLFPFYYTTGAPTEILVGRMPAADVLPNMGWQVFWIALSYAMYRILWKRGLRSYTAVGM